MNELKLGVKPLKNRAPLTSNNWSVSGLPKVVREPICSNELAMLLGVVAVILPLNDPPAGIVNDSKSATVVCPDTSPAVSAIQIATAVTLLISLKADRFATAFVLFLHE